MFATRDSIGVVLHALKACAQRGSLYRPAHDSAIRALAELRSDGAASAKDAYAAEQGTSAAVFSLLASFLPSGAAMAELAAGFSTVSEGGAAELAGQLHPAAEGRIAIATARTCFVELREMWLVA
jgi:hypothetical protein